MKMKNIKDMELDDLGVILLIIGICTSHDWLWIAGLILIVVG